MLTALIIGAGMFALPYIFSQAGFLVGFGYLAVFAVVFSMLHLMYAEVIESTPGDHRLVGYIKIHLGKAGEYLSFVTTILGFIITLLIYLVLGSQFLNAIHNFSSPSTPLMIFWAIATLPVLFNVSKAADLGFFITLGKIIIIFSIFFIGVKSFDPNLLTINTSNIFLPYSTVLFALYGRAAISSIRTYFKDNHLDRKKFYPAIILGTITSAILYGLFTVGVAGISNGNISADTISGLTSVPAVLLATALLGLLSFLTSYLFIGLELREIFIEDLKFKKVFSYLAVIFIPLLLYFLGLNNLVGLMGLAGGVFISLEAMLVTLMWVKVKKPSTLIMISSILLVLMFIVGAASEIWKSFY